MKKLPIFAINIGAKAASFKSRFQIYEQWSLPWIFVCAPAVAFVGRTDQLIAIKNTLSQFLRINSYN